MRYWVLAGLALALAACASSGTSATVPIAAGGAAFVAAASPKPMFDDEFDGSALDSALWSTCYPWAKPSAGCTNNPSLELEWYEAQNVTVSGGNALLTARKRDGTHALPFASGMISTGGTPATPATFSFEYGYAEARVRLPRGTGMWPAFWLVPSNRTWPPEIDIMEWQGIDPQTDVVTIHWGAAKDPQQNGSNVRTGVDLWRQFHTYAIDWEPSKVVWYFDGKAVKTFTDAAEIPHQPMYVILNLAIGGWVKGQLHPSPARFPATMAIDYVRVWKQKP